MNKQEILKFLEMFSPEVELFVQISEHKVPIRILTYEISDDNT
ncbi:hypothetical protein LCGC14_1455700, partial [marine sediment metagenome]